MPEQLWAPWRFDYVTHADDQNVQGCLFCALAARDNDRDSLILHRGSTAFVLLNAYPYTSGHLMVAPFRHVQDVADMDDGELLEVNQLVKQGCSWLREAYEPEGFNIGVNMGRAAGAGIPGHIHWHVVPRWSGDTNYMTAVAGVRVIPQDLRTAWDVLKPVADRLTGAG